MRPNPAAIFLDISRNNVKVRMCSIVVLVNKVRLITKGDFQYKEEIKMKALFNTFSAFVIVISCIGLFGLSAMTMQTRRKETGIRKVVGANALTIVKMMSKEFLILVAIGSLTGLRLSRYAMNTWLSKFAYRIDLTADVFVLSVIACVLIAFGSVIFNTLRAAHTNPVDSLRSE